MKALALLLLPFLELYGLVQLGAYITGFGVILYVIAAGALGMWIIKAEGREGFFTVKEQLQSGSMPEKLLFDKLFVFFAGILFLIPGVITDVFACFLLFPPTRHWFAAFLMLKLQARIQAGQGFAGGNGMFFYHSTAHTQSQAGEPTTVVYDCTVVEPETPESLEDAPLTIDCTDTTKENK